MLTHLYRGGKRALAERSNGEDSGRSKVHALLMPRKVGWAEILLFACVIFVLTTPFTFWGLDVSPVQDVRRDYTSMRSESLSQIRNYIMRFGTVLVPALLILPRWRMIWPMIGRLAPMFPFLAWAILSLTWSDSVQTTFNSLVALLMLLFSAVFINIRLSPVMAVRALLFTAVPLLVVSYGFVIVAPDYGMHHFTDATQSVHAGAWRGSYFHKNNLGQTCAMVLVGLLSAGETVFPWRWLKWFLIALVASLMVFSTSASALMTVPFALAIRWIFVDMHRTKRWRTLLYVAPALIFGVFMVGQLLELFGRDVTFTGRSVIWALAWEWFAQNPWIGYGWNTLTYGGFSYELVRKYGVFDPHNGYFETAMGTGVIGLVLWLIPLFLGIVTARRDAAAGGLWREAARPLAAVYIAWLFTNITEVDFRPLATTAGLGYFAMVSLLVMPKLGAGPVGQRKGKGTWGNRGWVARAP
jgi:exopolysaccharide production protein ExoQ